VDEAREILITHPLADYRQRGFGRWACILKSNGEHIGFCGPKYLKEIGEVDLGFRFTPANWGKGYATEAARASVQDAFDRLNLDQIVGLAEPENHASIRVLEKVGLKFTGLVRLFDLDMRRYVIGKVAKASPPAK
jgi:RimJ/RimL family protein N-acetyltransferase